MNSTLRIRLIILMLIPASIALMLLDCMPPPPPPGEIVEEIPAFPWPPPLASGAEVIPRECLLAKDGPTLLRHVDSILTYALEQKKYYESAYYGAPAGFVMVTRMEQMKPDGSPIDEKDRWNLGLGSLSKFSLKEYIEALFHGRPGHYRIIAFVVTPYAFYQSADVVTEDDAQNWFKGGLNRLPDSIGKLEFSREGYACTALIYEFKRASEADKPSICIPGLQGRTHLENAGIWGVLKR